MNTPFFFLHIPRTAGTTINSIIKHNFEPHEILSIYRDSDYRKHETVDAALLDRIRLIQGHLLLETHDPPRIYGRDVRVFTFLRNPVERLVSEYLFQKSWPDNHLYRYLNEKNVSFADYITSQDKRLKYRGKNFMTRAVSGMDFDLGSFPRTALDTAKRYIEHVFGFVGIQEMFDESLLLLRDFLGLRSIYHERMNVLRDGAKEHVTEADRALALERNAADAELYGFAVETFKDRIAGRGPGFSRELKAFRTINAKFGRVCALITARDGPGTDTPVEMPKNLLFPE